MSGIQVKARVLDLNNLNAKLDKLSNLQIKEALTKSAALVNESAVENVINRCAHNSPMGLAHTISYRVKENEAEVYTNAPYAAYVEFGTGKYAEQGGRPGWWVYVDEECGAPKSKHRIIYTKEEAERVWHILAAKYGAEHVWMTQGQMPKRFMRDALDDNKENISLILNNLLKEGIGK